LVEYQISIQVFVVVATIYFFDHVLEERKKQDEKGFHLFQSLHAINYEDVDVHMMSQWNIQTHAILIQFPPLLCHVWLMQERSSKNLYDIRQQ
jgi:hypothetical protein